MTSIPAYEIGHRRPSPTRAEPRHQGAVGRRGVLRVRPRHQLHRPVGHLGQPAVHDRRTSTSPPTEKGLILSAFSWSYALMQIPAGRLIDRFGERVMFGASVLVWSLFTAATAFVSSFGALLGLRLGLGVGEAGAYPAAAKTVSQLVPAAAAWARHLGLRQRRPHRQRRRDPADRADHRPVGLASGVPVRRRTRRAVGDRLVGLVPAAGGQGRGQRRRAGDHPREPPGSRPRRTCTRTPSRCASSICSSSAPCGA